MANSYCYGNVILQKVRETIKNVAVPPELLPRLWLRFVCECALHVMCVGDLKTSTVHLWQHYARQWRKKLPHLTVSYFMPLYSGSYLEGMPNSKDVDMLLVDQIFVIYSSARSCSTHTSGLIMSTADCMPGYIRIIVPPATRKQYNFRSYLLKKVGNKHFLSSFGYIQGMRDIGVLGYDYTSNGPALSFGTTNDIVYALPCDTWPRFVHDVLKRDRNEPLRPLQGESLPAVYVVAVGHHSSGNSDLEWRLSFSELEKKLVMGWTNWQRYLYFLLKQYREMYLQDPESPDFLCSYYMKTVMFWLSDVLPQSFWLPENFMKGFAIALSLLRTFLKERNIPNYFIPENNMISHKDPHQCTRVLAKLEKCLTSGRMDFQLVEMHCQKDIQYMFDFAERKFEHMTRASCRQLFAAFGGFMDYEAQMLVTEAGLLSTLTFMMPIWEKLQCDAMESTWEKVDELVVPDMATAFRTLLQREIASFYHRVGSRTSLKIAEEMYSLSLELSYPESGFDDKQVSGKIELALFHYLNQRYDRTEEIISELLPMFRSIQETYSVDYYLCVGLSLWKVDGYRIDQYLYNIVSARPRESPIIVNIIILALYILIQCYGRRSVSASTERILELESHINIFKRFGEQTRAYMSAGSFQMLFDGIAEDSNLKSIRKS